MLLRESARIDILFYVTLIVILVPIWINHVPLSTDFPQHVAQLSALKGLFNGNEFYSDVYEVNWFTPYIISNLFLASLAMVFDSVIALKIGISIYLITLPIVVGAIACHIGKPKDVRFLVIPFLYSLPVDWGFVPFLVASSFGMLWIYYFVVISSNPYKPTNILFSFFLMYSHAIAWGITVASIFIVYLSSAGFKAKSFIYFSILLLPLLMLFFWMGGIADKELAIIEGCRVCYKGWEYRVTSFIGSNLMSNDYVFGVVKLLICLFVISKLTDAFSKCDMFILGLLVLLVLYFITPNILLGTSFFSERLFVLLPLFLSLSINEVRNRRFFIGLLVFASVITSISKYIQAGNLNREYEIISNLESKIKPETRGVYYTSYKHSGHYRYQLISSHSYLWLPQVITNNKDVVVDFNFATFYPEMIRYKINSSNEDLIKNAHINRYKYPSIDWNKARLYDYIIIRDCQMPVDRRETIRSNTGLAQLYNEGCWWLFSQEIQGNDTEI
ncbi:hypothetical protein EK599_02280 [Vibrio sp. T187]|uniref:hypothetical protein n=1 Tax=Vibrio TaxID=662 RepID=UPI0010C97BC0|nr:MULTISPECIES: hypothetical protein [Vibrio]MBW3694506.1 hypothetical protein [Vibrio sp. T187]